MRRILPLPLLALALGCAATRPSTRPEPAGTAFVDTQPRGKFLTPAEIIQRIEASPVKYTVVEKDTAPGGWADHLWPLRVEPRLYSRVVVEDGARRLAPPHDDPASQRLLDEAEPHFQAQRFDEAAKLYVRATEVCPGCIDPWIFRGDAALFSGKTEEALGYYRKAAELNPDDYRVHLFQGHALARLGRRAEAREALATSLVLNPRGLTVRKLLRANPQFGLVITPDVVVPRGFAERKDDGVEVAYDGHFSTAWLAFAMCKGLWLGDPAHRKEMTGSERSDVFTSTEELECLGAALIGYALARDGKDAPVDEGIERLKRIAEAGMAGELVLFELAARVHPQVTLTMGEEVRARLRRYVLEHVLLERIESAGLEGAGDSSDCSERSVARGAHRPPDRAGFDGVSRYSSGSTGVPSLRTSK